MKKIVMTFLTALAAGCADHTMPVAQLPEIDTNNPLLAEWNTPHETPPFDRIRVSDYEPAFDAAIAVSRAEIDAIVNNPAKPTFNNTIVALDRQGRLLSRVEGIFFNLLEADATPEMQQVAENVQPKLTALSNDISLNPQLFERVKAVYEHPGWFLSKEDKKLLEETYNGFVRSGANLSDEDKELYRQYSTELSELSLRFSHNVLAATNAFTINITDPAQVAELPDFVRDGMAAEAKARGEQGWTVTLQAPSYVPFMEYSTNRELKEKLWRASNSLCLGGEFDNTENIKRMVNLRLKIANLLGYPTYADYVLADRMAENAQTVNAFLDELLAQTKEYAVKDYNTIGEYARSQGFEGEVMPWDMAYYSEKYRHEKYELNEELVKPYLQLDSVKRGESAVERLDVILDLIERLLGGGYMDGEVVGYFLHFLLQLPSLGRIVFPVKLIGKPLDPTHRDFVLGLMEEAVEEVRELLGRRVHSPAEPFAQLRTYSDCHSVIA